MIETRTALQNLDAIVDTPGIDGLFLGPSDLSIALSDGKNLDPLSKDVERELDRIIAAAQRAKKIPGAYCHSAERAAALAKRGVKFLAVIERSRDAARRRGGGAQGAQGRAQARAGQHPRQRAVAPNPMMHQRGAGMNAGENEKRIRESSVHRKNAARQRAIDGPRRARRARNPKTGRALPRLSCTMMPSSGTTKQQAVKGEVAELGGDLR